MSTFFFFLVCRPEGRERSVTWPKYTAPRVISQGARAQMILVLTRFPRLLGTCYWRDAEKAALGPPGGAGVR